MITITPQAPPTINMYPKTYKLLILLQKQACMKGSSKKGIIYICLISLYKQRLKKSTSSSLEDENPKEQCKYFTCLLAFITRWLPHFIQWTKIKIISICAQRVRTNKTMTFQFKGKREKIRGLNSHMTNRHMMWEVTHPNLRGGGDFPHHVEL